MSTSESYIQAGRNRLEQFFFKIVPHVQLFNSQTALYQAGLVDHTMPYRISTEQVKSFILDIYYNLAYILENETRTKWLHQFFQLTEYNIRPALHTQNTDHQEIFTKVIMKLKIAYYNFEAEYLLTQGLEHKEKAQDLKLRANFLQLQLDKISGYIHSASTSSIGPANDTKKTDDLASDITTIVEASAIPIETSTPAAIAEKKSFLDVARARAAVSTSMSIIQDRLLVEATVAEPHLEQIDNLKPIVLQKQRKKERSAEAIPVSQVQHELDNIQLDEARKAAEKIKLEQESRAAERREQERIQKEEKIAAEKQRQRAAVRERQQQLQAQRQAAEVQRKRDEKQQRKKEAEKRQEVLAERRAQQQKSRQALAAPKSAQSVKLERATATPSATISVCADLQALLIEPRLKDSLEAEGSTKYNYFTTVMNSCYSIAGIIKIALAQAEALHQEIATQDDNFAVDLGKIKQKSKITKEKKTEQVHDELEKYLCAINYLFEYFNAELETVFSLDDYALSILKSYILHVTAEFNMFMNYPKVEHAITLPKYKPLFDSISKVSTAIMVKALTRKESGVLTLLLNGFLCIYITVKQKQKISHSLKDLSQQVEQLLKELNPQVGQSRDIGWSARLSRREQFSQFSAEEKASALCNFIYFYSGNQHVFSECRVIILELCQTLDVTEMPNMAIWFKYIESLSLIFDREEKLYKINQQRIAESKPVISLDERPIIESAFDEPKVLLALIKHMNTYVDKHEELPPPFINEVLRYEKFLTDYIQHIIFCGSMGVAKSLDVNLITKFIELVKKLKQKKLYNQELSTGLTRLLSRLVTSLVTFAALFKDRLDSDFNEFLVVAPIILMSIKADSENDNVDSLCNQKMVLYVKVTLYFNYIHQLCAITNISSEQKTKDVDRFYEYMLSKDKIFELSLQDDFTILPDQDERGMERLAQDVEALQKDVCLEFNDENIEKLRQLLIEFIPDKKMDKLKNIEAIISRIKEVRQHVIRLSGKLNTRVASAACIAEAQPVASPVIFGHQLAGSAAPVVQGASATPELSGNGLSP